MKPVSHFFSFFLLLSLLMVSCANSQERNLRLVGGACEGCEAVLEYGDQNLNNRDTLPEFEQTENKLKLSGTIYKADGKTPAEDVILYIHHTNAQGIYPTKGDEKGWGKSHGYLRGWIKTGKDGKYSFYTQVPGSYPSRTDPAHIHPFILEPDGKYYYLETLHFEGDPLLTKNHSSKKPRGTSTGVLKPVKKGPIKLATLDFVLGKNIPGYK